MPLPRNRNHQLRNLQQMPSCTKSVHLHLLKESWHRPSNRGLAKDQQQNPQPVKPLPTQSIAHVACNPHSALRLLLISYAYDFLSKLQASASP